LGISAPPLSRAIRRLEADLGVTLFERTTHSVALTPAGEVFLTAVRIALDALDADGRRARRAAGSETKLVLAVKVTVTRDCWSRSWSATPRTPPRSL
jgi:DNA-binding transcriptional LysR family regulator